MSQIKSSFSNTMRRLSQPTANEKSPQKKKPLLGGVSKFKWPTATARQQQQPQKKNDIKKRFSLQKSGQPHQSKTGTKLGFLGWRDRSKASSNPKHLSFGLRKVGRWASFFKKNKRATIKAPATRPSMLRFRQR